MLVYYVINSSFIFYVQNGPKIVMLFCSTSMSTYEMAAFGVIQSYDILGQMLLCQWFHSVLDLLDHII